MLKKIPAVLPPELVKYLMEMGEGEEVILGGANVAVGEAKRIVRMDGVSMCTALAAILELFPLHEKIAPITLIQSDEEEEIWRNYQKIIRKSEESSKFREFDYIDQYSFENRSAKAYVIVVTGEEMDFASMILTKGKVKNQ